MSISFIITRNIINYLHLILKSLLRLYYNTKGKDNLPYYMYALLENMVWQPPFFNNIYQLKLRETCQIIVNKTNRRFLTLTNKPKNLIQLYMGIIYK